MIVTFWSPFKGKAAVTSSVVSIASLMAIENSTKVLMIDAQGEGDLESYFSEIRPNVDRSEGLSNVHTLMNTGKLNPTTLEDRATFILEGKLDYLRTTGVRESVMEEALVPAMKVAIQKYKMVFVDITRSEIPQHILEATDLLVLCLPQNLHLIKAKSKYLGKVTEGRNTLLLIGNYEDGAAITKRKLATAINTSVKNIMAVPHNIALMDALGKENVIDFFQRVGPVKKSIFKMDADDQCISEIRSCYSKIASALKITLTKEGDN